MRYPGHEPELDHFEGEAGKVANAWQRGDEPALRLAAQDLARSVVPVVAPLDPGPPVYSRTEALRRLLDVETALLPPAEATALRDGTFRRYVEQALRSG
jgi:hypothetical protein